MPDRFTQADPSPIAMKLLNFILPSISFALTSFGLDVDLPYVCLAIGSTAAGSMLLNFYRPEKTIGRTVYKSIMAAVAGVVFGSALIAWRQVEAPPYVAMYYCLASMLSLMFLKSVVTFGEANSDSLIRTVIQRVFDIPVKGDCPDQHIARNKGVTIENAAAEKPVVVIDPNAKPDSVRVIEETVVDTKE